MGRLPVEQAGFPPPRCFDAGGRVDERWVAAWDPTPTYPVDASRTTFPRSLLQPCIYPVPAVPGYGTRDLQAHQP